MNNFSILLYPKEAQKFLGVGPTTFYELAKRSDFPKPKSPLGKRVMYRRDELEKWVKDLE